MAVGMVTATAIAKELSQAESRLDVNPESDGGCHQRDREGHRHGRDRGSQQRGVFAVEVVASRSGSSPGRWSISFARSRHGGRPEPV